MLKVKQVIDFLKNNKGKEINYFSDYSIQIYDGTVLQANISKNGMPAFVKIEQRTPNTLSFFLDDKEGIIQYSKECCLKEEENILYVFSKFEEHPKIQDMLISLLSL